MCLNALFALFPSFLLSPGCRCFGRRGPSLLPSSSSTRSTLSPAREEGTLVEYTHSLPAPFTLPGGKPRRCVRPLFSHDKRPVISPTFTPEALGRRGADALSQPAQSVPMASPRTAAFSLRRTQNTALSAGVSAGWHWEHLWLKGERTGWGWERGRRPAGRGRTDASLCPSAADGEGQICSVLPGTAARETGYERGQRAAFLTDQIVPPGSLARTLSGPALASCTSSLLFLSLISVSHNSSKLRVRLRRPETLNKPFSKGNGSNLPLKFFCFDPLFCPARPPRCPRWSPTYRLQTQRRALKGINQADFLPCFIHAVGKRSAGSVDTGRRAPLASFPWRREMGSTCKSVSLPATGPKPPPAEKGRRQKDRERQKQARRWREKGRLSEMKIKC